MAFTAAFSSYRTLFLNSAALLPYPLWPINGKRWNLRLLEGLRKLLDDGKGQKRRGKEEDSGITGSIYSEDLAVFLKKLVKNREIHRIDIQSS